MKTTTKDYQLNDNTLKRLEDAMDAKKRIYERYSFTLSQTVAEQLKTLNELIRELTEELNKEH